MKSEHSKPDGKPDGHPALKLLLYGLEILLVIAGSVFAIVAIAEIAQKPKPAAITPSRGSRVDAAGEVKWGAVGAIGVGNIPKERRLTVREAAKIKTPRVLFPGYLPNNARLIMLYKWGPTAFIGVDDQGGYAPRASYPLLYPGGYPLIIQLYEIEGEFLVIASSPENQPPDYEKDWIHPIEESRRSFRERGIFRPRRSMPQPKYQKKQIAIRGSKGVLVIGDSAFSGPVNYVDWWEKGTRYLISGPKLGREKILRIAKSLNRNYKSLSLKAPSVPLRTEEDEDKLYGYTKGSKYAKDRLSLEDALKLEKPVVLVPKYLPKGAKFLYAYKWPDWENRIVLQYEIKGYFLDVMAEDAGDRYSRDYEANAPNIQVTLLGGAPVLPLGSYKPVSVGDYRGMAAEPVALPTEEDKGCIPLDQKSIGIIFWDKGGATMYSIRGFLPVNELIKIAESM